eukprot:7917974-Heterocapsa_arctica.AAC.1
MQALAFKLAHGEVPSRPGRLHAPQPGIHGRPAWPLAVPWPACPPRPPAQWYGRWQVVGTYAAVRGPLLGTRREEKPC